MTIARTNPDSQPTRTPALGRVGLSRRRSGRLALCVAAALIAAILLVPTSALAITRPTVLARAQSWVDKPVPYSQSKYHLGYRTDCSGYVSMCWQTGTSWATSSFHEVTHRITVGELKPGDAMLKKGYHIRLFHNWTNASHTSYVAYEAGTKVAVVRVHSLSTDLKAGYVPTRYNAILDGPGSDDVLWNGSFDAWSGAWGYGGEEPVMWQVDGARWDTLAVHRADVAHTGHNSIQLLAAGSEYGTPTDLSQTASITAGANYRLTAWARTPGDPAALTLSLRFLDAGGTSLAETSTTGDRFGLNDLGFLPMTMLTTAPVGAVNAVVTVQLAAPEGYDAGSNSATLDDISLARPRATASIRTSAATARWGKQVTLSGTISPSSATSVTPVVYVQPPKQGWKRLAAPAMSVSGSGADWRSAYAFRRGMRKGVYHFRIVVAASPGHLGRTSSAVSVKLK